MVASVHCLGSSASTLLLHSLVVELLVRKGEFFLSAGNFLHQLTLVECLLGHNLATQILILRSESLLDGRVLLTHNLAPDRVQFVQDLTDASLCHLTFELIANLKNFAHSLCRDPVAVFLLFGALRTTLSRFSPS